MRSKIAKKIQDETPEDVRIFVRQYTDIASFNKIAPWQMLSSLIKDVRSRPGFATETQKH